MGVKDLLQTAPVTDEIVHETGVGDLWNRYVPKMLQIGDTTNIGGKQFANMNKDFNNDSPKEIQDRFADTSNETPDSSDPFFYKLKNRDTGEVKFGIAPTGIDDRYAGQDLSNWDIVYNQRRKDAVDLEARIHGNESMLKRRAVDYGYTKNKFGKGGTEVYQPIVGKALGKIDTLLDENQKGIISEVKDYLSKAGEGALIASGYKAPEHVGGESKYYSKDGTTRIERMLDSSADTANDLAYGADIGVSKALGGLAGLIGADKIQEAVQKHATRQYGNIENKEGLAQVIGEILPEFALPATAPIKAGMGLVKSIGVGAGSGAVINAGYEGLKSQSGIKEGEEPMPLFAGGIGAVIGGFIGGTQGKAIAKAFTEGDEKTKEQIVQSLTPEQYGYLEDYVKKQQTPKQSKTVDEKGTIVDPFEKGTAKEVTPEVAESKVSKSGEKVTESKGMEKLSEVEYDVVKATEEAKETKTKRPLRKTYKTEARQARAYTEDGTLLSPQGDISQKASLKIKEQKPITNATEHVQDKLKVFDDEQVIKKSYGKGEARFKEESTKSSAQIKANRLAYEKKLYNDIHKDESLDKSIRTDARDKLKELNKITVKEYKAPIESITKAEKQVEKQIGKTIEEEPIRIDRQHESSLEFEEFKAKDKDYKEGFGFAKKIIPDNEIKKNIVQSAVDMKPEVSKAKARIDKQVSLGNKPNPADEYLVRQQAELRSDIQSYKNKEIDLEELRFREMRRLEDRLKKDKLTEFEDVSEIRTAEDARINAFAKLGISKKEQKLKVAKPSKGGEYTYKPEKDSSRIFTESIAKQYLDESYVPTAKTGKRVLRKDQVEMLDEGVTPEQLGRLASADKTTKTLAKEEIAQVINKRRRDSIGIGEHADIKKEYIFKDEMTDASNSAYQFISVLTGDKALATGTKLTRNGKDFRTEVAKSMKIDPKIEAKIIRNTKKKLLEEKQPVEFGKYHIKPLAMVWAYGSTDKSLIRTFAKDNGLLPHEAEEVFKEFNKVFMNKYPSAKILRDEIYKLQEKNKGTFTWTLPNGTKSNYTAKGGVKMKLGKEDVKMITNTSDMSSRALMPNIIHSIDGYAIQEVAKRLNIPVATVHDAVRTQKGQSDKVLKAYTEVMQEINDSNLLDSIMRELGYEGKPIKEQFGTLTKEDLASGKEKMAIEHTEGERIKTELKEIDDARIKTEEELMEDYMAGMDVRKIESNQMLDAIVNEQMYSDIITKPSDSPFENAIYHAMQSPRFTKAMMVPTPKGVSDTMFKRTQKDLFNKARAKLEYNPLLRDEVKGTRKYFDENGKPTTGRTYRDRYKDNKDIAQTVEEILRVERKIAEKKKIKNFDKKKSEVQKWKLDKELTMKEYLKKKVISDVVDEVISNKLTYKTAWNLQNSDEILYVEMRKLQAKKDFSKGVIDRNAENTHKRLNKIDDKKIKDIEVLLKSDYEAIRGITKEQVKTIKTEGKKLPIGINRHIEASAKGLADESKQFGFYARNAKELATRFKLDDSAIPLIDQLISIKAMDLNDGWKIADNLKDDVDTTFVIDMMKQKRITSERDIFNNNPEKIVKGYIKEVYRGQKELSDTGKVQYQLGAKYEEGLLGKELENKKIGTIYKEEPPIFKKPIDEFNWMQKNRLRKTNGVYRKVTGEDIRKELGKVDDIRESLTETVRTTEQKVSDKQMIMHTMIESDKGSLLFSNKPKNGFVELNEKQLNHLPYEMRSSVKYINREMFEPLMGREEIRLYNGTKRSIMMADRLANNFASLFKQNNVLKNPTSYLNSFGVNQALPLTMGINPAKHAVHQKDAMKYLREMNKITEELHLQKVTGKKLDSALQAKLKDNPLYQMERKGLSTNRVEGVLGDEDLLSSMLSNKYNIAYGLARKLNLSQKTKVGKETIKVFSWIDTMGRYSMVKSLMDKNPTMTLEKAIMESNGLYSNMDEMAPALIELLDKYPLVPFLKWFSKTSPKLLQVTKNNPIKSLMVAIGLYQLAEEWDMNISTINPLEAMIDFAEGSTPLATWDKVDAMGVGEVLQNNITSHIVPKYMVNAWRDQSTIGLAKLKKDRVHFDPYKGFVQSIIEGE